MQYFSKKTIASAFIAGVEFDILTLSEGRRIAISSQLSGPLAEIEKLRRDTRELAERARQLLASATSGAAIEALNSHPDILEAAGASGRIQTIQRNRIYPVYVRELLGGVRGIEIDGKPATTDSVIRDGPRGLYDEILDAVLVEMGLSEEEQKNSGSPTTSGAQVDGRAPISSAGNASDAETIN